MNIKISACSVLLLACCGVAAAQEEVGRADRPSPVIEYADIHTGRYSMGELRSDRVKWVSDDEMTQLINQHGREAITMADNLKAQRRSKVLSGLPRSLPENMSYGETLLFTGETWEIGSSTSRETRAETQYKESLERQARRQDTTHPLPEGQRREVRGMEIVIVDVASGKTPEELRRERLAERVQQACLERLARTEVVRDVSVRCEGGQVIMADAGPQSQGAIPFAGGYINLRDLVAGGAGAMEEEERAQEQAREQARRQRELDLRPKPTEHDPNKTDFERAMENPPPAEKPEPEGPIKIRTNTNPSVGGELTGNDPTRNLPDRDIGGAVNIVIETD